MKQGPRALWPWLGALVTIAACGDDGATADATTATEVGDTITTEVGDTITTEVGDTVMPDTVADIRPDVVIPDPPDCGSGVLITREGSKDGVSFRLDRCMPQICGGGCPVSSPQLVIVHPGGTDVGLAAQIEYGKTHHNWMDSLVATLPDRRLRWMVVFDFDDGMVEQHTVAIDALDDSPILAPITFAIDPHAD